jgi:hypothetical protein
MRGAAYFYRWVPKFRSDLISSSSERSLENEVAAFSGTFYLSTKIDNISQKTMMVIYTAVKNSNLTFLVNIADTQQIRFWNGSNRYIDV